MAATATSRLRLLKQAYNSNDESWGGELNAGALDMADEAWGLTEITVGANVTLTTNNYVSDQARSFVLECTGAGGFEVTTPAVEKPYWVVNDCSAGITIKPSGGTAATVRAGTAVFYYANGTVGRVIDPTLDKIKTAAGNVALGGNKLTGVGTATASTDAATLSNRLDQFAAPTASVAFNSQKITGLANGATASQDAASVAQVESLIASATVNLPAQTGNAGRILTTDGTDPSWSASFGAISVSNITVTGGSISGITDLAIADGGTGASTALAARTNLGIGTIATEDSGAFAADFVPDADNTRDLGSTVNSFAEAHAYAFLAKESSAAPSTAANTGAIYTKEAGGQTELFFREESDGDEVQLTETGGLKAWRSQTTTSVSGSAVEFTSLPAGIRELVLSFNGVALSGTDNVLIQIGDSGGYKTSGYSGVTAIGAGYTAHSSGILLNLSANTRSLGGNVDFIVGSSGPFTIHYDGNVARAAVPDLLDVAGFANLTNAVDRLRVIPSGSDTFASGTLTLSYR